MVEQRKTARRRTCLSGRISVASYAGWSVDCAVKDASEAGVKIAIKEHDLIPNAFSLNIARGPIRGAWAARIVWYRDGVAGLSFDQSESSNDAVLAARVAAIANRPSATGRPQPVLAR